MQLSKKRPVALQRDLKLEELPNLWRLFANWLFDSLMPSVPMVFAVGPKSPASVWRGVVFFAFIVGMMAMGRVAWAADECVINLDENTHTCDDVSAITFVSQPNNHQAVTKITLDPSSGYKKVVFGVTYNAEPTGWTVDICDSKSCNGYGGDAGDTSNASEFEVLGKDFNVYSNTLTGYETQTISGGLTLLNKPDMVAQGDTVSLEVSDEHIAWDFSSDKGELNSNYLFTLAGQPTLYGPVDYDIYAAFNRVISSDRRGGVGAASVQISLVKETSQEPDEPPLVLPTQELGVGELNQSIHSQTQKIRFAAPKAETTPEGAIQRFAIQQPAGLSPSATPEQAARHFLTNSSLTASFGLGTESELKLVREKTLGRKRSSVRFQQAYQDIPVLGGEIIVNMDAAKNVTSVMGEVSPGLDKQKLNTTPSVAAAKASEMALAKVAKQHGFNAGELAVSSPELWIHNPAILGTPGPQFNSVVWLVEVTPISKPLPIREVVLIDAHIGIIVFSYSKIYDAKNREIYDNGNDSSLNLPGTTPVLVEGGTYSGSVVDVQKAYDYSGDTYDFYLNTYGRDSIDDNGMQLISTVRYCVPSECPYENAYWNSEQMVYGEGFASADDVVGHELTHGVTEYTSGLFYFYQSGAINESFSDLWGEFIDQGNIKGTDTPSVKWQIGEDLPASIGVLRNMQDPTLYGQPDKMGASNYHCDSNDSGGVHFNSGVNNKAVYLMTDGDTFNGYTVTGLGIDKVAKLYYEVQTNLLTSAADYADLYDALLQACVNLAYGEADCLEVKKSLNAVEMGQLPNCPSNSPGGTNLDIPLCDNPDEVATDIFIDDFESGGGQWSIAGNATIQKGSNPNGLLVGYTPATPAWVIPQTASTIFTFDNTYTTSGVGNVWGLNQGGDYGDISDTYVVMKNAVLLPSGSSNLFMHFQHVYSFETNTECGSGSDSACDGGVLEYSVDGGGWQDAGTLITKNGYTGNIYSGFENPLGSRDSFVAASPGFISTHLDISPFTGQNIKFRFRIGTDDLVPAYGWSIDDVRIYSCQKPEDVCATAIPWDGNSHENDVVRVDSTLNIVGSPAPFKVKGLCNYGTIQETSGNLLYIKTDPNAGFIYNEGSILGKTGASSTDKSTIPSNLINEGDGGSSIKLVAGVQLHNIGTIKSGDGGAGYFKGGDGGSIEIDADKVFQEGTIAAGNGAEGNAHQPAWDGFGSSTGDSTNKPVYGNKPVSGGTGGRTTINARESLIEDPVSMTSSGNGGNAYVWCVNGAIGSDWWHDGRWWAGTCVSTDDNPVAIPTPGEGGDLVKMSPTLILSGKGESGKGLYYEPNTIVAGAETSIEAKEDIFIFGGDNWVLDLTKLKEGAISTPKNITLAVGNGGSIDLRGVSGKAFKAGGQFKVFSDKVLLDSGVTLENLVDAEEGIKTAPSKILRKVSLNAATQLLGLPNTTMLFELTLANVGPKADVYILSVQDSAGWDLSGLSSPITVKGLSSETLVLNLTLPSIIGSKNTITVNAVSQAEPSVSAAVKIEVSVVDEAALSVSGSHTASGHIRDKFGNPVAGVTVQVDGQTAVTDEGGNWEITGIDEGEYTVTASKDGYNFPSQQCVISDNEECELTSRARSDLKVKITPASWETKQGENQRYTITITNNGNEVATGVVLTDIIPAGTEVVSLESFGGGDCDADTVKCILPDLAPGDSVSVRLVISSTQPSLLRNTVMVEADGYPADLRKIRTWVTNYLSVFVTDAPDPVLPGGTVYYTVDVALNEYAPEDATDVRLSLRLPGGIELQSIAADHGDCDTGSLPKVVCSLPDLSLNDISRVALNLEVLLKDPGLLLLTHDAAITANEYTMDTARATTKVDVGDAKVDMVFVIDVTGSMREEINGVIRAIKRFIAEIDPGEAPSVALVTFRDEVTVKAVTSDLNVLLEAVEALGASGGGTCPEASAEALNIAIDHLAEDGFIFFTTDASPYPEADIPALIDRLQGINFVPVISGDCSQENAFNELPEQP